MTYRIHGLGLKYGDGSVLRLDLGLCSGEAKVQSRVATSGGACTPGLLQGLSKEGFFSFRRWNSTWVGAK